MSFLTYLYLSIISHQASNTPLPTYVNLSTKNTLTHPRLSQDVQFPEDCIQVLRCRPFNFIARSCNKWALNRVILLGDSAHVFPPFGGQGIASGFRDASALAWRLAVACRSSPSSSSPSAHDSLLTAWYTERKQQLEKSLAATIENGRYVTEGNALKIFIRDWYLWTLQLVPSWKHWLEMGQRREGMVQYTYQKGMTVSFLPDMGGGKCFPQVYCSPLGPPPSSPPPHPPKGKEQEDKGRVEVHFTDDVIFAPSKKGLFQIVALLNSVDEVADAQAALHSVSPDPEFVLPSETTYLIHDPLATPSPSLHLPLHTYRIATAEEFGADEALCGSRPKPLWYDMYRIRKEFGAGGRGQGTKFVVLRPDRFVYAVCDGKDGLGEALGRLGGVLRGE